MKVVVQYERGYGPHYTAGVAGVQVTQGACGLELDNLTATSCAFTRDFCGWTNTHSDHRNWLLTDQGGWWAGLVGGRQDWLVFGRSGG